MTQVSHEKDCQVYLERLLEFLEGTAEDWDVELNGKILTVISPQGHQYVLNFHEPTNQLWVSSPLSGAHHFTLVEQKWQSTRNECLLDEMLSTELSSILGRKVVLP